MVTILFTIVCVIIAVLQYLEVREIKNLKKQINDVDYSLSQLRNEMVAVQELDYKLDFIAKDIILIKDFIKESKDQNTTDHFDIIKYNNQIIDKIESISKENITLSNAILKTIDDKCLVFKSNKPNTKRNTNDKAKASKSKAKNSYEDSSATNNAQETK
jgi:hypothetical protein